MYKHSGRVWPPGFVLLSSIRTCYVRATCGVAAHPPSGSLQPGFRYSGLKGVRQRLVTVWSENGFMSRAASFVASGHRENCCRASVGTFHVKESLNVLLKSRPPFDWLPGLMKQSFFRKSVLVRLSLNRPHPAEKSRRVLSSGGARLSCRDESVVSA